MTLLVDGAFDITDAEFPKAIRNFQFTVSDMDDILNLPLIAPFVEVTSGGSSLSAPKYTGLTSSDAGRATTGIVDKSRVLFWLDRGATVVANNLERSSPPVAEMCRELESEYSNAEVSCIAFISPRGAEAATGWHVDNFFGLVYQVEGRKTWRLGQRVEALIGQARGLTAPPPSIEDRFIDKGRWLALPSGVPHYVVASDKPSLHLTFMIRDTASDFYVSRQDRARERSATQALRAATSVQQLTSATLAWNEYITAAPHGAGRTQLLLGSDMVTLGFGLDSERSGAELPHDAIASIHPDVVSQLIARLFIVATEELT
jgi:hypothetical protein